VTLVTKLRSLGKPEAQTAASTELIGKDMQKRDALRLKPGDWVIYGDSQWSRHVHRWRIGRVQHVTPRGGIKLSDGTWVGYHHVFRKEENPDDATIRHFS
jgi:hypothetical protein